MTVATAQHICKESYGLTTRCTRLVGYDDVNFLVAVDGENRFVLKCSLDSSKEAGWETESRLMAELNTHLDGESVQIPEIIQTSDGHNVGHVRVDGQDVIFRLLTFLSGSTVEKFRYRSTDLLHRLGTAAGTLNDKLSRMDGHTFERLLEWDVKNASDQLPYTDLIAEPWQRTLVRDAMAKFELLRATHHDDLRQSLIHNDLNDANILIARDSIGIIDFEDLVLTYSVAEPGVALAYLTAGQSDFLTCASEFIKGFCSRSPLTELELDLLYDFINAQLCLTVTMCARRRSEGKTDPYFFISEDNAWQLLTKLNQIGREICTAAFRTAAGLPVSKNTDTILSFLKATFDASLPLQMGAHEKYQPFDFSVSSTTFRSEVSIVDPKRDAVQIEEILKDNDATCALGHYLEPRMCYTGHQFKEPGQTDRTIHLGIDIFKPAGTPVLAVLNGTVQGQMTSNAELDYGTVVILRHEASDGVPFFSLYGHLSTRSNGHLATGAQVRQGETIGWLGDADENGGWVPHLHFQLMTDLLGYENTFPGVANSDHRDVWESLCPDPNLLLKIPGLAPVAKFDRSALLVLRKRHLIDNLSLSYEKSLHIVRGRGQYLYDDEGRQYLDCVNNVCHVGHSHPRIVDAMEKQARVLNTNTRYLHRNILDYAEALLEKFPERFEVCVFVNSGSEANDLALRMARAATGNRNIVTLGSAYHGNLGSLIDVSPYKFDGPAGGGRRDHVFVAPLPDTYRSSINTSSATAHFLSGLEAQLRAADESGGACAFIAESLSGCGGQIEFPSGYLKQAFEFARNYGAVSIADEVQVGFGRLGDAFWGFELQDAMPDIVTLGKPIGNGHPLGAVVTTRSIADAFANGMEYFNTFGGNPVSCAVGHEVLRVIEEEGLQARAAAVGGHLKRHLNELKQDYPLIGDVRGRGLFLGVELVRSHESLEPAHREAKYVVNRMKNKGILLSTDGPFNNVIKIKPPLAITEDDVNRLILELRNVLEEFPLPEI